MTDLWGGLRLPHSQQVNNMHPFNLKFEYYRDNRLEWRWALKAGNGRTLADSGEGYKNVADCISAINLVASSNGAPIVEVHRQAPNPLGYQGLQPGLRRI
jgi:uncharacterized protein YegP (UPF0339 family)